MNKKDIPRWLYQNRLERYRLIGVLYAWELEGHRPSIQEVRSHPLLTTKSVQMMVVIIRNYDILRSQISHYLDPLYPWDKTFPLLRSILLVGSYLLYRLDAGIVINEMIEYTKQYCPGDFYKFINKVLDKLARHHEFLRGQEKIKSGS